MSRPTFLAMIAYLISGALLTLAAEIGTLTDANVADVMQGTKFVILGVFTTACPECVEMKRAFANAQEAVALDYGHVKFYETMASDKDSQRLPEMLQISEFPAAFLFVNGEPIVAGGSAVDKDTLIEWAEQFTGEAVKTVKLNKNSENFDDTCAEYIAKEEHTIALLRPANEEDAKAFEELADNARNMGLFASLPIDEQREKSTWFIKRLDETIAVHDFEAKAAGGDFLAGRLPPFGPIDPDNFMLYTQAGKHIIWFVGTKNEYKAMQHLVEGMPSVYPNFSFAWVDVEEWSPLVENFLLVSETPAFVRTFDMYPSITPGRQIYVMKGDGVGVEAWLDKISEFENEEPVVYVTEDPNEVAQDLLPALRVTARTWKSKVESYNEECLIVIVDSTEQSAEIEQSVKEVSKDITTFVIRKDANEVPDSVYSEEPPSVYYRPALEVTVDLYKSRTPLEGTYFGIQVARPASSRYTLDELTLFLDTSRTKVAHITEKLAKEKEEGQADTSSSTSTPATTNTSADSGEAKKDDEL